MFELALTFSGLLLLTVVVQAILALGFVRKLLAEPPELISDEQAPRAAVILCLRGGDPFLADCLRGLLNQDYPNYDIRIVVDHPDDPAHQIAAEVVADCDSSRVSLEFLETKRSSCSLKCSSILQVVESLDDSYHFIAQLDADTLAHPTWLRELATGLADDRVGVATGNRWYMPSRLSTGSLVRYNWNAAAVVQMYWYQVAWGGTLAVKTRLFRETDLLEKWGNAFCEDTMLYSVLKKVGLRVAFVPSLMMINREECDLDGYFRWVCRQLMTARLYHPAWPAVVGHGVVTTLAPAAALVAMFFALTQGDRVAAGYLATAFLLYEASLAVLLWPMEAAVRKIARRRGEPTEWLSSGGLLKSLAIVPVTQVVYAAALAAAVFARSTVWRGIAYRVKGPWQIEMQQYQPYTTPEEAELTKSL
ncbi:MAG: glycosyltransferase family 2 protein [Planctomycetes bacterium]|nr:glycosyltransferase family 2 protein [Planctomycetota bacterium]